MTTERARRRYTKSRTDRVVTACFGLAALALVLAAGGLISDSIAETTVTAAVSLIGLLLVGYQATGAVDFRTAARGREP